MTDWNPTDPDIVKVHYDLGGWTADQQAELIEALAEAAIPHGWEGEELVVPEDLEPEVDALFEVLEARLGIASTEDGDSASGPALAEGEPLTEYDLAEWSVGDRAVLTEALVTSRVPHRWEDTVLLVPTPAEEAVEELMNDIESGQVWLVPEEDEDGDGVLDDIDLEEVEDPSNVLLTFKDVGEKLSKDPLDADGLEALLAALEVADPDRPLPGVAPTTWREVCALAEELADALAANDTPDEALAVDAADRLKTLVENLF